MASNLIFCFSGTGNSLKAAKDIAAMLGDTDIVLMKGDYRFEGKYDRVGFVFPSYATGMPKAAMAFVKALDIRPDAANYVFGLVTCGGSGGNSLPMLKAPLGAKGVSLDYGQEQKTVGNYIALYEIKPGIPEKLRSADEKMALYAAEIERRTKNDIPKSKLLTGIFYAVGTQIFRTKARKMSVSSACISCGKCAKLCPTDSILMQHGKPVFRWKTCAQCMACLQWCPVQAINCGEETEARKRYHHPDIRMDELM